MTKSSIEDSETNFVIKYDGEVLQNGTISVRDLTPALIGIMDAIDAISSFMYEGQRHPVLKIRAHEHGSFSTHLVLSSVDAMEDVRDFLGGTNVDAVLKGIGILGILKGCYSYIKNVKDPKKKMKKVLESGEVSTIIFQDGSTYEVPTKVRNLAEKPALRIALEKSLNPLNNEGITTFELDDFRNDKVALNKGDLPSFEYEAPHELVETVEIEETLRAETIALVRENKWRFDNFELKFNAKILDEEFLDRVFADLESFSVNDLYKCLVRIETVKDRTGEFKKVRSIVKVISHTRGMYQPKLTD